MENFPLTTTELQLKAVFQPHSKLLLNRPFFEPDLDYLSESCGMDLKRLLPKNMEAKLMENAFIGTDEDVAILRHLRYLPAMYHEHTFFEMIYVFQGDCINHINGLPVALKKGDLCLIAPGIFHAVEAFSDEAVIYNFLIRTSTFEQVFRTPLFRTDSVLNHFFVQALYTNCHKTSLIFTVLSRSRQHLLDKRRRPGPVNSRIFRRIRVIEPGNLPSYSDT